jgi:hypothetical protein
MMNSVFDIAGIRALTAENSRIAKEGDFPVLYLCENGKEERLDVFEAKRAFPFEAEEEFIVLLSKDGKDLGFIRALSERSEEERTILKEDLKRRYFMPKIEKILKVNEKFAFSYWKVETSSGPLEFSVRDTYKSLIHLGSRIIVTDADGNRYDIPDVTALDKSSRKKIDIYLW